MDKISEKNTELVIKDKLLMDIVEQAVQEEYPNIDEVSRRHMIRSLFNNPIILSIIRQVSELKSKDLI